MQIQPSEPAFQRFVFVVVHISLVTYCIFTCMLATIVHADEFDEFVETQLKLRRVPGLSLAVIRDGEVLRSGGYGMANLEVHAPATAETVYEIGSISKQFAAQAILLLVEDGQLHLDDSITKYLPANVPPAWEAITISNLLQHTSGLKDWTELQEFSYRRQYSAEEFIELVRDFPLEFRPNDDWKYSNTNLPLVGIIVEAVSGQSYEQFVTERIFNHFRLPSIQWHRQEAIVAHRASGYRIRDNQLERGEPFRPTIIAPSGGVLANVVDLARWWELTLSAKLLKESSHQQLQNRTRLNDGRNIAHGLAMFFDCFNGNKMVHHHGSTVGGFGSVVRNYPEANITIAVMSNLEDGGWCAEQVSKRLANLYVPGAYIGGLVPLKDPLALDVAAVHLKVLNDLSEGKNTDLIASSYAEKISDKFRQQNKSNLASLKSFAYLGKEPIAGHHFVLDNRWTEARYFKMETEAGSKYYHIRCHADGEIGLIFIEE